MAEPVVPAPEVLGLDERETFRQTVLDVLDVMAPRRGRLIIDLAATRSMDSAGLGCLMLVQRRAAEKHIALVLRDPQPEVRFLLMVTRLDALFELEPATRDPDVPSA